MTDDFTTQSIAKCEYLIKALQNASQRAEKNAKILETRDNRFAFLRLLSTISYLAVIVQMATKKEPLFSMTLIASFFLFCLFSAALHNKIQKKHQKWLSLCDSYKLSLARVSRNFQELSKAKSPWHNEIAIPPEGHIYSTDLDIHNQLFLLINTCSTKEGSKTLFELLMQAGIKPENQNTIQARSQCAMELCKNSKLLRVFESARLCEDFLKHYYKTYENNTTKNNAETLKTNGENQNLFSVFSQFTRLCYSAFSFACWTIILLPALSLFIKTSNTEAIIQPLFFYSSILIVGTFIFSPITNKASEITHTSKTLIEIINLLSKGMNNKKSLQFTFLNKSSRSSIKRLHFLVDMITLRNNPIFWITLHLFIPFDAIVCTLLQLNIKKTIKNISIWRKEVCDFDVIASLARFSIENKSFHFVTQEEIINTNYEKIKCKNIGHPLIPTFKRICNNIDLNKKSPVVLLTGSNMAGKSTFLRTLGINVVLANIGAPVCAEEFLVPNFRLLCAIRIDDSLADGTSYFYAEVKRLQYILESLNSKTEAPGFFLIDEIFRGTNNKERFIGSWHIIHALFDKNTFGFISTHDLALTELEKNDSRLMNMHFREHIEDNQLAFDYLIKEGPCPTTNALFIMKQKGLPVP